MALPTTGTISLLQVAAELGVSPPLSLNDSRTRALAGIPTGTIDLNSLRGKSSGPTLTINITSSGNESAGLDKRRDYFNLQLNWTGSTTPSSYTWVILNTGYATITNSGSRTPIVRGPAWNPAYLNYTVLVGLRCTAVIGGVSYQQTIDLNVTQPGDI